MLSIGISRGSTALSDDPVDVPMTGSDTIVTFLRFHRPASEPARAVQVLGINNRSEIGTPYDLRCADLKASVIGIDVKCRTFTLHRTIAQHASEAWRSGTKSAADGELTIEMVAQLSKILPDAAFAAQWATRSVLATCRSALDTFGRCFDVGWFRGTICRYRWVSREILGASFFLQIAVLLSPLFLRGAIDEGLVHCGIPIPDILAVGLASIALFGAAAIASRTYIAAPITNRIDVTLGTRLPPQPCPSSRSPFPAFRAGAAMTRARCGSIDR